MSTTRRARKINADIPPWLRALVDKRMARQPDIRCAWAEQVAHAQNPATAALPIELVPAPRQSARRFSWKGVALMMGTVATIWLGAFLVSATPPTDIAGRWQSDDWGEIVLQPVEGKPHQYTGAFTGADDPTYNTLRKVPHQSQLFRKPQPTVGKLVLRWSQIEGRFVGTWQSGDRHFGRVSLRLDANGEIRGALTTTKPPQDETGPPRLADLHWQRIPLGVDMKEPALDSQGRTSIRIGEPRISDSGPSSLNERLQGEWLVTTAVEDGHDLLQEFDERYATIVVDGNLLTIHARNKGRAIDKLMALTLVGAATPQAVDVLLDPNDTEHPCPVPAIIECTEERFRFCCRTDCGIGAEHRPKVFAAGDNIWLFEARRMQNPPGPSNATEISSPAVGATNIADDSTAGDTAPRRMLDQLQGEWLVGTFIDEGADGLTAFEDRKAILAIRNHRLLFSGRCQGKRLKIAMKLALREPGTPQAVDITWRPTTPEKGRRILAGIIEFDGRRLRICCQVESGAPESKRPTKFAAGDDVFYIEAHRMPPG